MSAGGISYDWTVEGKAPGVDDANAKLAKSEMLLSKLDKVTEGMTPKMKAATDHLGKHADGFRGVGHAIEETRGKLSHFLEFTGAVVAYEAVEKLTDGVIELGKEILKAGAGEQRTEASFKLNYGEEGGQKALEYAEKFAKYSEYTEDQAKGFLGPLLAAGVPIKEMDTYMAAASDSASKFGNKLEGMQAAVNAFSKMELTGKLDGRSLKELKVGVPQLRELEEYRGKTDKQLKEILEKGSLTKSQVFRMIAAYGTDKDRVGDVGEAMGKLMGAKLDKLAALPERLFQGLYKAPAFGQLSDTIDHLLEKFDPDGPGGKAIVEGLGGAFTTVVGIIESIDFDEVGSTITDEIIPAAEGMFKAIKPTAEVVLQMAKGLGVAVDFIHEITGYTAMKGAEASLKKNFKSNWGTEEADDTSFLRHARKKAKETASAISDGLEGGMSSIDDVMERSAQSGIDATKSAWKVHSPSKVAEEIGANISAGMELGLGDDITSDAFAVLAPGGLGRGGLGGGAPQVFIEVNVDGRGKDDAELGQLIAAEVAAVVPSVLLGAFEQANDESGAS